MEVDPHLRGPGPIPTPAIPLLSAGRQPLEIMNALSLRVASLLGITLAFSVVAHGTDYDTLREKWATELTGGALDSNDSVLMKKVNGDPSLPGDEGISDSALTFASSMQSGSGRTTLWTDLPNVIW